MMIEANELSQAIANEWEKIAQVLGDDRGEFESKLTVLLRQLENASDSDQASAIEAIYGLFQGVEAAWQLLIQAVGRVSSYRNKGVGLPAGYLKRDRYTVVPVFYGTDRALTGSGGVRLDYGCERGELGFGIAEVSVPDDHRMGKVERPSIWRLEFREDPDKHVAVLEVMRLSLIDFTTRARCLLTHGENEILLFVHGYNVGFIDAVSRTAQIAYDLHFEGLAMLYSWPSENSVPKYTVDENNIEWSRPRFAQFLSIIREKTGAETIHVVGHSMGSRLVAETVAGIAGPLPPGVARMRQVAFAAPDIDAATFKDLAVSFQGKAERFTLYASSKDKALQASKLIHKYRRAGDSGMDLVITASIDTVDATAVDTSLLGHSYYGDNRSVLADLFELIRRGTPPEERFGLKPMRRYGDRYWLFGS
jgi:esterase/lipase superfamily enzyme